MNVKEYSSKGLWSNLLLSNKMLEGLRKTTKTLSWSSCRTGDFPPGCDVRWWFFFFFFFWSRS